MCKYDSEPPAWAAAEWIKSMKIIGILIILNSITATAYWISGEHPHKGWVLSLSFIAVFVGVVFTLHDRAVEITFEKVGSIKAAAKQATVDAGEVSAIRQRIEAQSATVDLIARETAMTVENLRGIACITAKTTLTDLMASNFGFSDGATLATRLAMRDEVIAALRRIGIGEDQIEAVDSMWKKGVGVIYFRGIRAALEERKVPHQVNMDTSPERRRASREFQELLKFEGWQAPSPDEIQSFIEEKGFMTEKVKSLITDYRRFCETGDIQNRDVFQGL